MITQGGVGKKTFMKRLEENRSKPNFSHRSWDWIRDDVNAFETIRDFCRDNPDVAKGVKVVEDKIAADPKTASEHIPRLLEDIRNYPLCRSCMTNKWIKKFSTRYHKDGSLQSGEKKKIAVLWCGRCSRFIRLHKRLPTKEDLGGRVMEMCVDCKVKEAFIYKSMQCQTCYNRGRSGAKPKVKATGNCSNCNEKPAYVAKCQLCSRCYEYRRRNSGKDWIDKSKIKREILKQKCDNCNINLIQHAGPRRCDRCYHFRRNHLRERTVEDGKPNPIGGNLCVHGCVNLAKHRFTFGNLELFLCTSHYKRSKKRIAMEWLCHSCPEMPSPGKSVCTACSVGDTYDWYNPASKSPQTERKYRYEALRDKYSKPHNYPKIPTWNYFDKSRRDCKTCVGSVESGKWCETHRNLYNLITRVESES